MKDYYERMTPEQARAFKGGAYDQIRKNGAFLKNAPFFCPSEYYVYLCGVIMNQTK